MLFWGVRKAVACAQCPRARMANNGHTTGWAPAAARGFPPGFRNADSWLQLSLHIVREKITSSLPYSGIASAVPCLTELTVSLRVRKNQRSFGRCHLKKGKSKQELVACGLWLVASAGVGPLASSGGIKREEKENCKRGQSQELKAFLRYRYDIAGRRA